MRVIIILVVSIFLTQYSFAEANNIFLQQVQKETQEREKLFNEYTERRKNEAERRKNEEEKHLEECIDGIGVGMCKTNEIWRSLSDRAEQIPKTHFAFKQCIEFTTNFSVGVGVENATSLLTTVFPGSKIACRADGTLSGELVNGKTTYLISNNSIVKETTTPGNGLTYVYNYKEDIANISDGKNYIILSFHSRNNRYIDVNLPILAKSSTTVSGATDEAINFDKNTMIELLNKLYLKFYNQKGLSMFELSNGLLLDPQARSHFVSLAETELMEGKK